jgi:hypothetical protein
LTVGTVTTQSSGTVASGKVISENPAAATSVAKGSAVALVVSSGPPKYTLGGTLIGLGASASVQVLNGTDTLTVSANGAFTLPTAILSGGSYTVTVGTPTSTQTCAVQNGTGTVSTANVTNVVVYCTYNVTAATLNGTHYATAIADFAHNGGADILDGIVLNGTYDGVSAYSGNATFNSSGGVSSQVVSDTYYVGTTNGIATLTTNSGASGGIEGANANAVNGVDIVPTAAPGFSMGVLTNTTATTTSLDGDYTLVGLAGSVSTGAMSSSVATITATNGTVTGTAVSNSGGTISTGTPFNVTWSVSNGVVTVTSYGTGAVSADGDLIVLADTTNGQDPSVDVAVRRGAGVTKATFEGVYSVSQYGGSMVTATFGQAITLFAYGNGTYSITFTKNANGTVTQGNTNSGTYAVAADGALTLTDSDGNVYTGALAADGDALVLASVSGTETPSIFAGIRQ